jgi:Na+/H+ antiporter NhaD/arsenite permease-like protein
LLLFFAGLFVVVHGFETTQVAAINKIAPTIMNQTGTAGGVATFSAAVVAASNVFGNVPFVMLIRPWITNAPDPKLLWLLLAMASTFAGNLTLVGSVANLIVANGSKNECPLGFWTFMKVGVPSTIVTVVIGVAMLYAMHGLGL